MQRVLLSSVLEAQLTAHLRACYPLEGCGVLIGLRHSDTFEITDVRPVRNIETVRGEDRFTLDPREYAALECELHGQAETIIGYFHSHPDGLSQPSSIDLEAAAGLFAFAREVYLYAIQPTTASGAGELTFWRLAENASEFVRLSRGSLGSTSITAPAPPREYRVQSNNG